MLEIGSVDCALVLVALHVGKYILHLQARTHIDVAKAAVGAEMLHANHLFSSFEGSLESLLFTSGNVNSNKVRRDVNHKHTTKFAANKLHRTLEVISGIMSGNS